ncbi:hypothetical protein HYV82_01645 [Candidatus Woesearchaeota archaeon]|nr:hypothetical protein [Candidatus Woesearchaeota archaeon]
MDGMNRYFVSVGNVGNAGKDVEADDAEAKSAALDALLQELGAENVRKYEFIRSVYVSISDEAMQRLMQEGYIVEPENTFKALSREPSQPLQ